MAVGRLVGLALVAVALAAAVPGGNHGKTSQDWPFEVTGIRALQSEGLSGRGIRVAVLDTGMELGHPVFSNTRIESRQAFLSSLDDVTDSDGHGTHVAGVLAGEGSSLRDRLGGIHVRGAAPGIELAVHQVHRGGTEGGNPAVAAEHVRRATRAQVDLICMSLGYGDFDYEPEEDSTRRLGDAVADAVANGVLVVVAAGTEGANRTLRDVQLPANVPGAIAVGAVDRALRVAAFSAAGNPELNGRVPQTDRQVRSDPDLKPEVVAPGVGILGPWLEGGYAVLDGTSQAVPFVCGGLALVLESQPWIRQASPGERVALVKRALSQSAQALPGQAPGVHFEDTGYGLFRADRLRDALAAMAPQA